MKNSPAAISLAQVFAGRLLKADYNTRAIREQPGHSDIKTTVICIHSVPSWTLKALKSPLDLQT